MKKSHPTAVMTSYNPIMAGNDIFMPGGQKDFDQVKEALKKGEVTREQLEINASRLLKVVKG